MKRLCYSDGLGVGLTVEGIGVSFANIFGGVSTYHFGTLDLANHWPAADLMRIVLYECSGE